MTLNANHAMGGRSDSRASNRPPGIGRKKNRPSPEIEILCPTRRHIAGIELILLVGGFNGQFPQGDPAQPTVQQLTLKNPIDQEVPGDLSVAIPAIRSDFSDLKWHCSGLSTCSKQTLWATR